MAAGVVAAENCKLPLAKSQLANKFANYRGHRGLLFCSADHRLTGAVEPRAEGGLLRTNVYHGIRCQGEAP